MLFKKHTKLSVIFIENQYNLLRNEPKTNKK